MIKCIVFDRLQNKSTVPLVSIVEATRNEAIRLNKHKLGLLGTIFTMTEDFLRSHFTTAILKSLHQLRKKWNI